MNKKRIVITGIGILSKLGKTKEEFWQAIKEGRVGYAPVTLFDTSGLKVNIAGEISDFDATLYLGKKGLRNLDRATKLISSAARLALDDTGFSVTEENTDSTGIVIGTTLGSVASISEFDKTALRDGPRAVNPAEFPNTVINSPASHASIFSKIKGFNTTVSTGFSSALSSLYYACDFLNLGRSEVVLSGSVEEMCLHTFLGFYKIGFMAGSKNQGPILSCPFDKRRNGIIFSEGAVIFLLEDLEHAKNRGANILAEIKSIGLGFDCFKVHKYNPKGEGIIQAMRNAISEAGFSLSDIDCIIANANSSIADRIETNAIKEVFFDYALNIPISGIKSMLGESYSASGGLALAAALGCLNDDFIPPTINYLEPDPECDLDYVPNKFRAQALNNIMINSFGPGGQAASCIVSRFRS